MTSWSLMGAVLYLGQGLLWSAGGFVVGLLFMRQKQRVDQVSDDLEKIKEIVVTENAELPDDRPEVESSTNDAEQQDGSVELAQAERVVDRWKRGFGIVLIVLSVFTVGQAWYFSDKNRSITDCQARQAKAFQQAQVSRAEVAEQDRQVLDNMIIAIAHATKSDDVRIALSTYIAARAKNDAERAKAPLPAPLPAIGTCDVRR